MVPWYQLYQPYHHQRKIGPADYCRFWRSISPLSYVGLLAGVQALSETEKDCLSVYLFLSVCLSPSVCKVVCLSVCNRLSLSLCLFVMCRLFACVQLVNLINICDTGGLLSGDRSVRQWRHLSATEGKVSLVVAETETSSGAAVG